MTPTTTQVKFTIESDIVAAFKTRCANEEVSMTSVIRQWMETRQPTKNTNTKILTRPQRRKTVIKCIALLTDVLEKEEEYRDLIPEQFNQRYETADHFCEKVAEAIECLEDAL